MMLLALKRLAGQRTVGDITSRALEFKTIEGSVFFSPTPPECKLVRAGEYEVKKGTVLTLVFTPIQKKLSESNLHFFYFHDLAHILAHGPSSPPTSFTNSYEDQARARSVTRSTKLTNLPQTGVQFSLQDKAKFLDGSDNQISSQFTMPYADFSLTQLTIRSSLAVLSGWQYCFQMDWAGLLEKIKRESSTLEIVKTQIKESLARSVTRAARAQLIAVSKTKPPEMVLQLLKEGQTEFGQNYVDELVEKAGKLPAEIGWHFIGHLQSNKARKLLTVRNLRMIHTVDSVKLADVLHRQVQRLPQYPQGRLKVLVQLKTSEQDTKYGCSLEQAVPLAQHILNHAPKLQFCGLMTIGKEGDLSVFEQMRAARAQVSKVLGAKEEELELSMGMSGDFQAAVEGGATMVRVGSLLFGAR